MKTNNKNRLLEVMGRLDSKFKPIINEDFNNRPVNNDNDVVNLIYNAISAGWITDLNNNAVNKTYDSENIYTFKINEKYIKLVEIDEKGVFLYVDGNRVNGDSSVLVKMYNLLKNQNLSEELSGNFYKPDETPVGGDFSKGEYFDAKLDELLQQMKEYGIEYDSIMQNINKFYPNGQGELQEYGYGRKSHSTYGQSNDPRTLTLKRDAVCKETGKPLKAGEQALYYPSSKDIFSLDSKQADEYRSWKADMDMGYDY